MVNHLNDFKALPPKSKERGTKAKLTFPMKLLLTESHKYTKRKTVRVTRLFAPLYKPTSFKNT